MSIQTNSPDSNLAASLSADGIVDLFSGTPDGTKFLRDDGTLALPSGAPAIADITDWPSGLSATELGYVNGVTSAIQTQLDNKGKLIIHALRITSDQTGLSGSSAENTVILNSIPTNLGGYFTESSGVWTCAIACTVRIMAQIYQSTSSSGNTLMIYRNSTAEAWAAPGTTGNPIVSVDKILSFTAGQTFKVTIAATSAPVVAFGDGFSWLQVTLEA